MPTPPDDDYYDKITPPDGHVFRTLKPDATLAEVIVHANHQYRLSISTYGKLSEIHGYIFNGTIPCTKPADKCTAIASVQRLERRVSWQKWGIAALTIVIPATVTAVGVLMSNYQSARASSAAVDGTKTTLAIEMPKYLKSIEETADKASDRGSDRALRKFVAEQNPKPIGKIGLDITKKYSAE
jgi:hypothetical protein